MENTFQDFLLSRRKFVSTSVTMLSASASMAVNFDPLKPERAYTIAQVIDIIKESITLDTSGGTVDTVKSGDPAQNVTGIVTTMFATVDVIRKAIELKANFIIAHEPTFYNHLDETKWLEGHEVFDLKRQLLEKHNIVVWRFHDYLHANRPDGVLMGVLTKLGWEKDYDANNPIMISLSGSRIKDIIENCKKALGIQMVRYVGDLEKVCKRIAILPGAWGGRRHMQVIHEQKPDLLICGELQEWETSEYIRDARSLGLNRSLIVLGHSVSEEPGMEWVINWLKPKVPGVNITHIASGNPFSFG
jgi:putative NIF3 family GTP cyclohydrolase 1 type 2